MRKDIFENTEVAFSLKSDAQLERAYFLFKMIAIEPLVKIGTLATNFALKISLPIEGLIRSSVFDHFCGGITEEDCLPVIDNMYKKGVSSVLDYSVEGKESEEEFDKALKIVLNIIDFAKALDAIPIAVFKPSGLGRTHLFEKKSKGLVLTKEEVLEWNRVEARFNEACNRAKENDVAILIDAEESWLQAAADALVTKMMELYNKQKAIVYNTLQMYRHDRMAFLEQQHKLSKSKGYFLGFKVVRGAYMEKENDRAEEHGYITPICKDKVTTDANFNSALKYIIQNLDCISIFAGTHNEESTYLLMELMEQHGIENNDPRIWFGQLYGMSDHISFNLSNLGYNVAKYMPFGPVKDVMPYLIRRAEENTSVVGQTGRELTLIKKEKQRRGLD